MTSQPPTGPPSGALSPPPPPGPGSRAGSGPGPGPGPGPGDGSGRRPSGRRFPRNPVLVAVGAAVVVAPGLVVLLRAVVGDDPVGGSSTPRGHRRDHDPAGPRSRTERRTDPCGLGPRVRQVHSVRTPQG
ncbi:hypothetical protein [Streptomyces sp. NBC_00624]|uniref:hypothetical protein n=1 Tax=Streptomyces sp. NBC_00624 TaxID=2975791 RepID=UPI0030E25C25